MFLIRDLIMKKSSVLCLSIFLLTSTTDVFAKNYCVTNSAEFQSALHQATDNFAEPNEIRLASGNYPSPEGGFRYKALYINLSKSIKISGGWRSFRGVPCAQQFTTTLDGNEQNSILHISQGDWADV